MSVQCAAHSQQGAHQRPHGVSGWGGQFARAVLSWQSQVSCTETGDFQQLSTRKDSMFYGGLSIILVLFLTLFVFPVFKVREHYLLILFNT